jgi:hypothetical protein
MGYDVKQEFLKPTLDGQRFQDHTVPLELFKDFSALQEMLIEVAKWEFLKTHPKRERIPRHFTDGLDLHLEAIEEGSAILKITLVFASLFPSSHLLYFEQAESDIVEAIASAESGEAPTLPANLLNYFDRIGRGLRPGESISFVHGNGKATLTPETRKQLMRSAQVKEWTEEAALRVRIPEVDKGRNSFQMELGDGNKLTGELNDSYRETILQAFDNFKTRRDEHVLIQGIVRKDRDDRLKEFESIEHVSQMDPLDIASRLDEISNLQDGWLDGQGHAPSKDGLVQLGKLFDTSFDADLALPFIYPTAEGGVQAEWNMNDWAVTLEIDLATFRGEYQALNLNNTLCDERTIDLSIPDGWVDLNAALNQLEKQIVGDRSSES